MDITQYNQIRKFRYGQNSEFLDHLTYWPTENSACNLLKGTDGTSTNPKLTENDPVYAFSSELYRSFQLNFTENTASDNYDIPTLRYEFPLFQVAAPNRNPENACYCDDNFALNYYDTKFDCYEEISGSVIASDANGGVPVMVSLPHFLGSDYLLNYVNGQFDQNYEKYSTFIEYEPKFGTAFRAAKKIQTSFFVPKSGNYDILDAISEADNTLIVPITWANENFIMPEDYEKGIATGLWFIDNLIYIIYVVAFRVRVLKIIS